MEELLCVSMYDDRVVVGGNFPLLYAAGAQKVARDLSNSDFHKVKSGGLAGRVTPCLGSLRLGLNSTKLR